MQVTADILRLSLSNWASKRGFSDVRLMHNAAPVLDKDARYAVIYEAVFEPKSLDLARVEIWCTKEGATSIGFETRERVAARLGIRCNRHGFAAGHEPYMMLASTVSAVLDKVASGCISIRARTWPLAGLGLTDALISEDDRCQLLMNGYQNANWLHVGDSKKLNICSSILRYSPWR